MLNAESLTRISAITLIIATILMLGYHLSNFQSKQEAKTSENYTVIDRPHNTGQEVVILVPMESPTH